MRQESVKEVCKFHGYAQGVDLSWKLPADSGVGYLPRRAYEK
ncbi:hypothetical protein [Pseudomonas sp. AFG_SD02_1510_Pfu_092]|nr:hypothetical protein [Pseudomonas sp. AFG_SD02_1510_Pfu_092]